VVDRELLLLLGAALTENEPLPLPFPPDVIVSQLAGLVAVHVQPAVVVTVPVASPPLDGSDWLVGVTLKLHAAPA
jgi:hypothetical protein